MKKIEQNQEKEKIFKGAIAIFYKKTDNEILYLVVENTETGNISFVSGAEEIDDQSLEQTVQREIEEELGLNNEQYDLNPTQTSHDFVFGKKKKERIGHKGSYKVFLGDVSNISNIKHTKELKSAKWMTKKEVLNSLSFDDLKEVFKEAIKGVE